VTAKLWSLRAAAAYLGLGHPTLYAMAKRGEVPFVAVPSSGGRRLGRMMFRQEDLDAAIARWRVEVAS
jgi:excisionase family DNA binding protein